MKRLLYFILMIASVVGASYVALFLLKFDDVTGWDTVKQLINDVFAGEVTLGLDTFHLVRYGIIVFLVINIAILFTMVVMFLMNFGLLNRIYKFYSVSGWFILSALLFTAGYVLYYLGLSQAGAIGGTAFEISAIVPIAAAAVMFVIGLLMKRAERRLAA